MVLFNFNQPLSKDESQMLILHLVWMFMPSIVSVRHMAWLHWTITVWYTGNVTYLLPSLKNPKHL